MVLNQFIQYTVVLTLALEDRQAVFIAGQIRHMHRLWSSFRDPNVLALSDQISVRDVKLDARAKRVAGVTVSMSDLQCTVCANKLVIDAEDLDRGEGLCRIDIARSIAVDIPSVYGARDRGVAVRVGEEDQLDLGTTIVGSALIYRSCRGGRGEEKSAKRSENSRPDHGE